MTSYMPPCRQSQNLVLKQPSQLLVLAVWHPFSEKVARNGFALHVIQVVDMQLIVPCSIVIVGPALIPDDPSILAGLKDESGLIQTVFVIQRRAWI